MAFPVMGTNGTTYESLAAAQAVGAFIQLQGGATADSNALPSGLNLVGRGGVNVAQADA